MFPCHEYAELAVETITGPVCSQSYGAPLNYLCWLVGSQVYNRYSIKNKENSGVLNKVRMTALHCTSLYFKINILNIYMVYIYSYFNKACNYRKNKLLFFT